MDKTVTHGYVTHSIDSPCVWCERVKESISCNLSFKSLDTYFIKDRGKVFVVENPKDNTDGFSWLINKEVWIDGKMYVVVGVEKWAIPFIRKGEKIGLLVKENHD